MRPRPGTLAALLAICLATGAGAQLPFYTDDPAVTPPGSWHFEFFNEFDLLQHQQYPNVRQNTANYKLNYGLPKRLELDVDAPYLAIFRDAAPLASGCDSSDWVKRAKDSLKRTGGRDIASTGESGADYAKSDKPRVRHGGNI
jgi:hypothetical protein